MDKTTQTAKWGGFPFDSRVPTYLQLPAVPTGCLVRVYHFTAKDFKGAPVKQTDWSAFLRAQGIIFPKGGFAVYFPPTATLIVANTAEQLALLNPL